MHKTTIYILMIFAFLAGCGKQENAADKTSPSVTKQALQLEEVPFEKLPGWAEDNLAGTQQAFAYNCAALSQPGPSMIGSGEIKISRVEMQNICNLWAENPRQDFRRFISDHFKAYRVLDDGESKGKFTAYFESALHASYHKSNRYQFPVYGKPLDLIEFNPHDFDPTLPSKRLVGRVENQKLIPYFTRSEIMEGKTDATPPVILWADSYVDIYVMQIQGSAVAQLDDGSKVRVGYADTNGLPFKGIGSILLEKKLLKPGQASMGKIKQWLKDNYQQAYPHMNENQRFVFHRIIQDEGPIGALGVPLTPGRSMAVDRKFIPLGSLLWLDTKDGNGNKLQKLVFAQDIGGAIKGAVRGDYFWGSGGDEILEHAGKMNSRGSYYILLPAGKETE